MSSSSLTPADTGSDLSDLSDIESAELEKKVLGSTKKGSLDAWLQGHDGASASPPPAKRKRDPSPAHDYVLADNPDIAFLVMFRARFATAFPRFVPNFGPQDIENSIVASPPTEIAEKLLCGLLGLVLNRKKDIGLGHYTRALEDAIFANKHQWPTSWQKSPISGDGSFNNMTPEQRLNLLKTLVLWSLNTSEAIQGMIKESYKQNRHDDDLNQPLSVQPWGRDGDKRRYWLIEGQDDTHFRLYRESNPALKTNTWWSVAGNIDEIKAYGAKLIEEGSQPARRLSERIDLAVARFEAGEEKRKRREYRLARKAQFSRPEPGFSLYEGRTRGKRIKYTFSDDEDGTSDAYSARQSTRNGTPAEHAAATGPTITSSGRQVRSRAHGVYGESLLSGQRNHEYTSDPVDMDTDAGPAPQGTRTRSGRMSTGSRQAPKADSDEESEAASSGNEWNGDGEDEEDDADDETDGDDDVEMDEDDGLDNKPDTDSPKSLVVKLRMSQGKDGEKTPATANEAAAAAATATATPVQAKQLNGFQVATPPPSEPQSQDKVNGEMNGPVNGVQQQNQADQTKHMPLGMPKKEPASPYVEQMTPKSDSVAKTGDTPYMNGDREAKQAERTGDSDDNGTTHKTATKAEPDSRGAAPEVVMSW